MVCGKTAAQWERLSNELEAQLRDDHADMPSEDIAVVINDMVQHPHRVAAMGATKLGSLAAVSLINELRRRAEVMELEG